MNPIVTGSSPYCLDEFSADERTIMRWTSARCMEDQTVDNHCLNCEGRVLGRRAFSYVLNGKNVDLENHCSNKETGQSR
ncbi:hypothetical protein R6Q59_027975 [Mikania micrantha]